MVYYIAEGDIFKINRVSNFAHGCNCAGVMGKGIALQFKSRFPQMYEQYKLLCKNKEFTVGSVFKYPYIDGVIYNLGTQRTWKERAELRYIESALCTMMKMAQNDNVTDIAMPSIGAGLGGMEWKDVKRLIDNVSSFYPSVDLYVVDKYCDVATNIYYIKKYWEEENVVFYFHFVGEDAVRQVEIHTGKTVRLSVEHPFCGESMLCDQGFSSLELSHDDFISKEEFENAWNSANL